MSQAADGELPGLKHVTTEAKTKSKNANIAQSVFIPNQSNVMCLPLVSDSQKVVWVHLNHDDPQLHGTAELDKAFDTFPYLTEKQTSALAKRCSLHPDRVKVWFMLQRLRYGISWDSKDIREVRKKVRPNQRKEKLHIKGVGDETNKDRRKPRQKKEVEESTGNKEEKINSRVHSNKQLKRKMQQEEKVKKGKKRRMITALNKNGKKRMKQVDEATHRKADEAGIIGDQKRKQQTSNQSEATVCTKDRKKAKANQSLMSFKQWPPDMSFLVSNEEKLQVDFMYHNNSIVINNVYKQKLLNERKSPDVAEGLSVFPQSQESHVSQPVSLSRRIDSDAKAILRVAFCYCQYPKSEVYDQLAMRIGVPRCLLIQWFGDMRYYIKKVRPRWMSREQHSRALGNIMNQQKHSLKVQSTSRKSALERHGSFAKHESETVHLKRNNGTAVVQSIPPKAVRMTFSLNV